MKKFALGLFMLLVSNFVAYPDDINNFYRNEEVGFSINFPSEWGIYTSRENAIEAFKPYFDMKDNNGVPTLLFAGMTKNQLQYVRCLAEKTDLNVEDYFRLLYAANKSDKLSVISAKYIKERKSINWIYVFEHSGLKFKFYETVFTNGTYSIRLAFWTHVNSYNDEAASFKSLTESASYKESGAGDDPWKPLWKDLNSLLPEKNIDKIEIADEPSEKKKDDEISYKLTEKDKLFFYEIAGEKNKVYILGSIHVGHPEFYPMPAKIEDAFKDSKYLVVEINIESEENRKKLTGDKSILFNKDGKTLEDVLPEELYEKLEKVFRETGMSIKSYEKLKPWVVSSVVVMFQMMNQGFSPEYGIDKYFTNKAKKKKIIKELETLESQIDLFESKINQNDYLASVLLDYKMTKYKLIDLIKAWRNGDEDALIAQSLDSFDQLKGPGESMKDALIFKRNDEMSEKIKAYLKDEGDYFVVVGAAHLIGEKGIISNLKKAGFKAEKK